MKDDLCSVLEEQSLPVNPHLLSLNSCVSLVVRTGDSEDECLPPNLCVVRWRRWRSVDLCVYDSKFFAPVQWLG